MGEVLNSKNKGNGQLPLPLLSKGTGDKLFEKINERFLGRAEYRHAR
jgi:hypothetical protein